MNLDYIIYIYERGGNSINTEKSNNLIIWLTELLSNIKFKIHRPVTCRLKEWPDIT